MSQSLPDLYGQLNFARTLIALEELVGAHLYATIADYD